MTREFEELRAQQQREELRKLQSAEDKMNAKVGRMTPTEFAIWSSEEIYKAERAAEREPPAPKRQPGVYYPGEMDRELDQLNNKEYVEFERRIGISNTRLDPSLSECLGWDGEQAEAAEFDDKMNRWNKRHGGE